MDIYGIASSFVSNLGDQISAAVGSAESRFSAISGMPESDETRTLPPTEASAVFAKQLAGDTSVSRAEESVHACQGSYKSDEQEIGGIYDFGGEHDFKLLAKEDKADGFSAAAYYQVDESGNPIVDENGKVVVYTTYRGTDEVADWDCNVQMADGIPTDQAQDALDFADTVGELKTTDPALAGKDVDQIYTGHSLGGGLAEIAAAANDGEGYTFNALGTRDVAEAMGIGTTQGDITNYTTREDLVPALSEHIGECLYVDGFEKGADGKLDPDSPLEIEQNKWLPGSGMKSALDQELDAHGLHNFDDQLDTATADPGEDGELAEEIATGGVVDTLLPQMVRLFS